MLTPDQKRILKFIRQHDRTTFAAVRDSAAGEGYRYLTQDLLAELYVLEAAGKISLALNVSGKHIRATEAT